MPVANDAKGPLSGLKVLDLSRVLAGRLRLANEKIDELYDKTTDSWDRAL